MAQQLRARAAIRKLTLLSAHKVRCVRGGRMLLLPAEELVRDYPWLEEIYQEIAMLRRKPEEVLGMWSDALRILDENTMKLYVEELEEKLQKTLEEKEQEKMRAEEKLRQITKEKAKEQEKFRQLTEEKDAQIAALEKKLKELSEN